MTPPTLVALQARTDADLLLIAPLGAEISADFSTFALHSGQGFQHG